MIKDVKTFQPDRHEDFRGDIYTTWNNDDYPKLNWRLDKFAHSQKNVLRGLHMQKKFKPQIQESNFSQNFHMFLKLYSIKLNMEN